MVELQGTYEADPPFEGWVPVLEELETCTEWYGFEEWEYV